MITVGETLGPYIVEALIAQGGMGAVYRARNRVTGQLRALKIVRPDLVKQQDFAERFVREVTIASQVRHPNLVETLEPGIDEDIIYLPMELLVGETLAARLKRAQRFSSAETAAILVPIADAVQALHDKGLVHRDLKPMNIFLARVEHRDVPKVIDLGTARDVEDEEHTKTGLVVGSPYYMAVEQAEGRKDIDGRADQYALGVIAYQMLTGARPYESDDTRSALAKLLRGEPYIPPSRVFPGVSGPVEQVVARALAHDRQHRFPRIADFGAAFAAAVQHQGPASVAGPAAPRPDVPTAPAGQDARGVRGPGHGLGQAQMVLSTATLVAPEGESSPLEAAMQQALAITGAAPQGGAPGGALAGPGFAGPGFAGPGFAPAAAPGFAPGPSAGAPAFAGPPAFAAPPADASPAPAGRSKIVWALFALAVLGAVSVAGAWFATRPTITATTLDAGRPPIVPVAAPPVVPAPVPAVAPPVVPAPVVAPPVAPPPVIAPPVASPPVVPPVVAPPVARPVAPPVVAPPVARPVAPPVVAPPVARPVAPPVVATPTTTRPTLTPTPTTTRPTPTTAPTAPTTTRPTPTPTPTHSDPDPPHRPRHPAAAPCGAATGIPCLE